MAEEQIKVDFKKDLDPDFEWNETIKNCKHLYNAKHCIEEWCAWFGCQRCGHWTIDRKKALA